MSAVYKSDASSKHTYLSATEHQKVNAGIEIGKRIALTPLIKGDALTSPGDVRKVFSLHLAHLEYEAFCGLFLDNRHRVIEFRELYCRTIDSSAVYPRDIVKRCLACNCAAVIFGHNHPSSVAEPPETDVRLTRKLIDALALIDIRVLDHLVIARGVQTSLAERGLM